MRLMGQVAVAGLLVFVAAVLTLHAAQPELSPRDTAVSYYVHGRLGALLTAGLAALGIASLALVAGLAHVAARGAGRAVAARRLGRGRARGRALSRGSARPLERATVRRWDDPRQRGARSFPRASDGRASCSRGRPAAGESGGPTHACSRASPSPPRSASRSSRRRSCPSS